MGFLMTFVTFAMGLSAAFLFYAASAPISLHESPRAERRRTRLLWLGLCAAAVAMIAAYVAWYV
jgi:hypothetical protein